MCRSPGVAVRRVLLIYSVLVQITVRRKRTCALDLQCLRSTRADYGLAPIGRVLLIYSDLLLIYSVLVQIIRCRNMTRSLGLQCT